MSANRNPIWFVAGEKGGVGKSTCAHILIDYARERLHAPLVVVETDESNPDVGRVYVGKENEDVVMYPFPIHSINDWMRLLDLVAEHGDAPIVINAAAQLLEGIRKGEHLIHSVAQLGRDWVTWWVLGPEIDSVDLLDRYLKIIPDGDQSHRLVVIENAGRADERDFLEWRKSNLCNRLRSAGCPILPVSHLATDVADELRSSAWSIAEGRQKLRFARRIELERWRNAAFASISEALGDGSVDAPARA